MSHEEIWDDSALVDSWNDAVAEYKKYHSIAARGERVEDVLRQHEKDGSQHSEISQPNGKEIEAEDEMMEDGAEFEVDPSSETLRQSDDQAARRAQQPQSTATAGSSQPSAPPLPAHLVGSIQDEGMKNLLMSWYYAGYYTGLYKGQQQAAPKATADQ